MDLARWEGETGQSALEFLAICVSEDDGDMANQDWRARKGLLVWGYVKKGPTWLGRNPPKFLSTPCLFI